MAVRGSASIAMPARKAYRPEIDGLRAIAVLAVLVNHLWEPALPGGFLGVDVFFVISGYVVTSSLIARKDENWRQFILHFYQRHFRRLMPVLILNILVTMVVFSAFELPIDDVRFPSIRTGMAALFGVSTFIYSGSRLITLPPIHSLIHSHIPGRLGLKSSSILSGLWFCSLPVSACCMAVGNGMV